MADPAVHPRSTVVYVTTVEPRRVGRRRATGDAPTVDPRQDLLIAASKLFSRLGTGGTSMGAIAREAGLRGSSIYHYFETKTAIIDALVEYAVAVAESVSNPATGRGLAPDQRLRQLLDPHLEHLLACDYDLYFLVGINTHAGSDPPGYERWRRAVQACIRDGARRGVFRDIDPTVALHMIIGCIQGGLLLRHRGNAVEAGLVTEFVLAALRPQ